MRVSKIDAALLIVYEIRRHQRTHERDEKCVENKASNKILFGDTWRGTHCVFLHEMLQC